MKFISTCASLLLLASPFLTAAEPGHVDFGKFVRSSEGEYVEINLQSGLLKIAALIAEKEEPAAAELLRGLKYVRVKVIGIDEGNRTSITDRVTAIRDDLSDKGWEQIVTVRKGRGKKDDVAIFVKQRADETIEGVVITVIDGKREAVLVNVVGSIKPDQLAALGEHLPIQSLKKVSMKLERE